MADVTFNLRYPGQYADKESGLSYNYFRSYDSRTGRYTQADPIDLAGGWNRFAYAEQNPLSFSDPLGLAAAGQAVGETIGRWGGRAVGGAIGTLIEPGGGTIAGGLVGGVVGGRIGGVVGSAVEDLCSGGPNCDDLNKKVQEAKTKAGQLGACRAGMPKFELQRRYTAWVELGAARAKRDESCWSGGDLGHQQAQAAAWSNAGVCSRLMQ